MRLVAWAAVLLGAAPQLAHAVGLGADEIQIHGFVSQGFILSSDHNYLAESEDGSFELAEMGINFTVPLTERLRSGLQLFTRDLGPIGDYKVVVDWAYLDYRWQDWLGLRAGRIKLPFGLYNDTSDVDAARTAILLPQAIYPTENRDFLLAQTGVELYGYLELGGGGALDYRAYFGTIFLDLETDASSPFVVENLSIPYVVGGRILWETPLRGLRLGASLQALRLESILRLQGNPMSFSLDIPAILWVGSLEYVRAETVFTAEYSRWHTKVESSNPAFPSQATVSERGYAMLTHRIRSWLQPGLYYSIYYPDVDDRSGWDNQQHDLALTVRFDINAHWLLKLEGHYMRGLAILDNDLNDEGETEPNWAVFLAKTTAYF